jgi:hypothetical protein
MDTFAGMDDPMATEARADARVGAAAVDSAAVDGAPAGAVVGIVEKPASTQPPSR